MKLRLLSGLLTMLIIITACQSGPPPTMYVMEVTRVVTVMVQPDDLTGSSTADSPITVTPDTSDTTETATEETPETTPAQSATPTPDVSPTPDVFPTPVVGQIFVAEQNFERGKMFWIQPVNQIWVTTTDADGVKVWQVYDDTFEEGMIEEDPSLEPPDGRLQPVRGFGKLWRENPDVRQTLGWATEPEFGHNTRYEYHAGGTVTGDFEYIPAEGYHLIETLQQEVLRFNEDDRTWEIVQ